MTESPTSSSDSTASDDDSPSQYAAGPHYTLKASELPAKGDDGEWVPVIPPEEWEDRNIVDDVTGNPDTDAPDWIIDAVIEYHGSRADAGLTPDDTTPDDTTPCRDDGQQHADGQGDGDASTAGRGAVKAIQNDVEIAPDNPYRSGGDPAPLGDLDAEYDNKDPRSLEFWRRVWSEGDVPVEVPLTRAELLPLLQTANAIRKDLAEQTVTYAAENDLLITDTVDETQYFQYPTPSVAPGRYLEDPRAYADPAAWRAVWDETDLDYDDAYPGNHIVAGVGMTADGPADNERLRAIIAVGEREGIIVEGDKGDYYLGDTRFPPKWVDVWEQADLTPGEEGIGHRFFQPHVSVAFGTDTKEEARAIIDEAEAQGIIYREDDTYHLNDPASSDGPPIEGGFGSRVDSADDGHSDAAADTSSPAGADENGDGADPVGETTTSMADVVSEDDLEDDETAADEPDEDADTESTTTEASTTDDAQADADGAQDAADTSAAEATSDTSAEATDDDTAATDEQAAAETDADQNAETSADESDDATGATDEQAAAEPDPASESETSADDSTATTATADTDEADQESASTSDTATVDDDSDSDVPTPAQPLESPADSVTLPDDVQEAFDAAIAFFQAHLDIKLNPAYNDHWTPADPPDDQSPSALSPWPDEPPHPNLTWPETSRDYFKAPSVDVDLDAIDSLEELPEDLHPENLTLPKNRGWLPETVEEKRLGYCPSTDTADLAQFLSAHGFDRETLIKTGLFVPFPEMKGNDVDDSDYPDPPEDLPDDWRDCDITSDDLDITPQFTGRFVFPYFNRDNDPVYAISRSLHTDAGHPADYDPTAKYTKAWRRDWTALDEPIYGLETIRDGEGLVITEGIADAISAHELGIPCISPVTKSFKDEHREILSEIIEAHDIPVVYLIQDADPPSADVVKDSRIDKLPAAAHQRIGLNHWLRAEADDTPVVADVSAEDLGPDAPTVYKPSDPEPADDDSLPDPLPRARPRDVAPDSDIATAIESAADEQAAEQALAASVRADSDRARPTATGDGPIAAALSPNQFGPGLDGAVKTAAELYLSLNDIDPNEDLPHVWPTDTDPTTDWVDVHIVELPRFGPDKMDLDDYLQDGWLQYCPIADWTSRFIIDYLDDDAEPWSWLTDLSKNGHLNLTAHVDPRNGYPDDHPHPHPPATGLFGVLASVSPPYLHPGYDGPSNSPSKPSDPPTETGFDDDADTGSADSSESADSGGGSSRHLELYDISFRDFGLSLSTSGRGELFRGKNPMGHTGDSEDYFLVYSRDQAFCNKQKVTYTPLTMLLVDAGIRDFDDPEGKLSDAEKFYAWKHAKEKGYISSDARVPHDGLLWFAKHQDIATDDDIEKKTYVTEDGQYSRMELPPDLYNETLDQIKEEFGLTPGRNHASTGAIGDLGAATPPKSKFRNPALASKDGADAVFFDQYLELTEVGSSGDDAVWIATVAELYNFWAELNSVEQVSHQAVGEKVRQAYERGEDYERDRAGKGGRPRYYEGLRLSGRGEQLRRCMEAEKDFAIPASPDRSGPNSSPILD